MRDVVAMSSFGANCWSRYLAAIDINQPSNNVSETLISGAFRRFIKFDYDSCAHWHWGPWIASSQVTAASSTSRWARVSGTRH